MNNIITIKELCEQEIDFLYNYIDFSKNRSHFFSSDDNANKLILEFLSYSSKVFLIWCHPDSPKLLPNNVHAWLG